MRQRKVVALGTRGAGQEEPAKAQPTPATSGRAGISPAPDPLSDYRGPRAVDEATYNEHAGTILEQFGVGVESPELTVLASRWGILHYEHLTALQRIALRYARLLEKQREERQAFLRTRVPGMKASYTELAAAVKAQYPDGYEPLREAMRRMALRPAFLITESHRFGDAIRQVSDAICFDAQHDTCEAEGERLLARLRQGRHERPTRKARDAALIRTAHAVAEWTKQHGPTGKRDWVATVRILECHGWDLGKVRLGVKAHQLEDRVRKSPDRTGTPL